jgi:hypothetical protein
MGTRIGVAFIIIAVAAAAFLFGAGYQRQRDAANAPRLDRESAAIALGDNAAAHDPVEQARSRAFSEFMMLYGAIGKASSRSERETLLAQAADRLPAWYANLGVRPPDMRGDWMTDAFVDFLPEQAFQIACMKVRLEPQLRLAAEALHLPNNPTRRELAEFFRYCHVTGQLSPAQPQPPTIAISAPVTVTE